MTTTLITGAGGWLGSRMVEILLNGLPDVPGLERPTDRKIRALIFGGAEHKVLEPFQKQIEIVWGDTTKPASLVPFFEGAEGATLFHCAGVVHPTNGVQQLIDVNATGARNVLEAAVKARVRRAVVISSNSPIGVNPTRDGLFDETAPYNPYMTYGKSKMMMERIVHEFQASGRIETVILRPPWFYGPRQPERQTMFFTMIKEGKAPIVGDGENRRSMAYVDNSCQGMLLAEKTAAASGETYWIADERPYTMNAIIDTIERLLESEFGIPCAHKRMQLPSFASEVAFAVDKTMQGFGLYNQKIHVLSEMNKTIACSVEKAKRELNYQPAIFLEEGMRRSIKWCIENGHRI